MVGLATWSAWQRGAPAVGLSAAHQGDDFDLITGLDDAVTILFARNDFRVDFDGQIVRWNVDRIKDLLDRHRRFDLHLLAVDRDLNHTQAAELPFIKGRVEGPIAGGEIEFLGELAGFLRTEGPFHPAVFPFDRQGTVVADVIQGSNDLFKVDAAATGTAEIPTAPRVAEVQVAGIDPALAVERHNRVLDMDMIDAVRERSG